MDEEASEFITHNGSTIPVFNLLDDVVDGGIQDPEGLAAIHPERVQLALPSALPQEYLLRVGCTRLTDQELELRRGQAHDALQGIRLAIGQKSFQYTSTLRAADRKAVKTRARSAILNLSHEIAGHRRVYVLARAALITLGISALELERDFRELRNEDLHTSTAVVEPNARGISKKTLSWIWRIGQPTGDPGQGDDPALLSECEPSLRFSWTAAKLWG